jgi:hypothetical protein
MDNGRVQSPFPPPRSQRSRADYREFVTPKAVFAAVAGLYFLWCVLTPDTWRFLDYVNLVIHEAGHFIFAAFGHFMAIAGGSIMQVLMPAAFVVHFLREAQPYSAGLVAMWLGESIGNVATYASDAVTRQLPLITGDSADHDWHNMLAMLGILHWTPGIGFLLRALAVVTVVAATALAVWASRADATSEAPEF